MEQRPDPTGRSDGSFGTPPGEDTVGAVEVQGPLPIVGTRDRRRLEGLGWSLIPETYGWSLP